VRSPTPLVGYMHASEPALVPLGGGATDHVPYFSSVAAIDMDQVLRGSLGPAIALRPDGLADVVAEQDHFRITGVRPQFDYVVPGAGVNPAAIGHIAFDFACRDSKVEPTLQLL
jgi:hypothetical protein